jgi:DNA-binding transcriptional MerR regulator
MNVLSATRGLVSINIVMARFGLTARAIRYYEAFGLIASTRDRRNYRCFDYRVAARLELISRLRRAGIALGDIGRVLGPMESEAPDISYAVDRLTDRARKLEDDLVLVREVLSEFTPAVETVDLDAGQASPYGERSGRSSGQRVDLRRREARGF